MGMTQNANTTKTVATLIESIHQTTGVTRDNHARELLKYVQIDLVAMLVAASDRHQAAESALAAAIQRQYRIASRIRNMEHVMHTDEQHVCYAVSWVMSRTYMYMSCVIRGNDDDRIKAQASLLEAIKDLMELIATEEGKNEIPTFVSAAMSEAMAQQTERATSDAYLAIQILLLNSFPGNIVVSRPKG